MHVDAVNFCAMPAVVPRSAARGGSRRALLLLMLSVVTLVLFVNNLERPQTVLRWSAAPSSLQQQAVAGGSGASPSWGLLGSLDRASDPLLASPIGGADAASVSSASPPPPSAVALAAPPPPPPQQQEQPPPGKPCAAGCEARGTCNRELGRCDCPPFMGGDDCARPLFPACAEQWGLRGCALVEHLLVHQGLDEPVGEQHLREPLHPEPRRVLQNASRRQQQPGQLRST